MRIKTLDMKSYRREDSKNRREVDPVRYLFNQARYRAKKRGIEFSIELSDLVIPDVCPIMGIPLYFTSGVRSDNSYSIDRRDNSKGYTLENTRVISWLANGRKGDLSVEQIENLYRYVKGEI